MLYAISDVANTVLHNVAACSLKKTQDFQLLQGVRSLTFTQFYFCVYLTSCGLKRIARIELPKNRGGCFCLDLERFRYEVRWNSHFDR